MRPSAPGAATPSSRFAPGEAGHEGVGRGGDELRRRARLQYAPVDEDADAIGQRGSILEVVGDENRRQGEVAEELVQLDAHLRLRVGVERRKRLVEEEDAGVVGERPGERDPLALAAGQLADARTPEVGDLEPLEQVVDGGPAADPEADVAEHVEMGEERVLLEQVADRPALRRQGEPCLGVEPRARRRARPCRGRAGAARRSTRSTVVLPAPDGPTSATVAPSATVSATEASKPRRGWEKSTSSAIG